MRIVMNPEKMVIQEARRAYTYLQLYGYGVDAVIVNRILPTPRGSAAGWESYLESQAGNLEEIEAGFSPLPILRVPHQRKEVLGIPMLRKIGQGLYRGIDPTDVLYKEPTYAVTREDDAYVPSVRLPFIDGSEVAADQYGDQFVIQVANQREIICCQNSSLIAEWNHRK